MTSQGDVAVGGTPRCGCGRGTIAAIAVSSIRISAVAMSPVKGGVVFSVQPRWARRVGATRMPLKADRGDGDGGRSTEGGATSTTPLRLDSIDRRVQYTHKHISNSPLERENIVNQHHVLEVSARTAAVTDGWSAPPQHWDPPGTSRPTCRACLATSPTAYKGLTSLAHRAASQRVSPSSSSP